MHLCLGSGPQSVAVGPVPGTLCKTWGHRELKLKQTLLLLLRSKLTGRAKSGDGGRPHFLGTAAQRQAKTGSHSQCCC